MDLDRQPVVVEAVDEIITTFKGLSELPQSRKGMRVGAPLNIIIRSLISGCSTASITLSKPVVSFNLKETTYNPYREASSCIISLERRRPATPRRRTNLCNNVGRSEAGRQYVFTLL